jgi:cob(I)alamin adenosyltransferase
VKVYTKRGDSGETDLAGGGRVGKDDPRVEAYGAVDELNAFVGLAAIHALDEQADLIERIQRTLFRIGASLATNPAVVKKALAGMGATAEDVADLEAAIDVVDEELPELRAFVLPGGTHAAAAFHVARTVCRRAERRVLALDRLAPLADASVRYLNRLSDLLFVLARLENHRAAVGDVLWTGRDG